jgi:hypothetical protein
VHCPRRSVRRPSVGWFAVVCGHEQPGAAAIRFTLNGRRYELSRAVVEARLADVAPDTIRKSGSTAPGFRRSRLSRWP